MWNLTRAAKSQIDKTGGNSIVAAQCRRKWKLLILFFFFFLLYRILHAVTQHCDRGWNRTCVPIDLDPPLHFPPSPWNVVLHHRGLRILYSLRISTDCGVFYVPQESEQWKSCETAPMVFLPYPRRLKKTKMYNCLTICCRCHNKGSTFSSVIGTAGDWTGGLNRQFVHLLQPKRKNVIKHS